MPTTDDEPFAVVIPPPVQVEVEKLAGRSAGYGDTRRLLGQDPCQPALKAYRLSGPLEPVVCGVRLKRGYRLAFTTQPPLVPKEDARRRVVVLYVGKREPGHRGDDDVWDLLHDLFGTKNPPVGHDKPPCCAQQLPEIRDEALDAFVAKLRRVQRGR
ncbi:hypothetical protein [Baekduia sp. Peel2402]|uniref:hypothetical protein n=1 Tax=Baekduia sp. Peel2402 TaxID=3458296 RepID=UPI00403E903D